MGEGGAVRVCGRTSSLGRGAGADNIGVTASCYRWERVHRLRW